MNAETREDVSRFMRYLVLLLLLSACGGPIDRTTCGLVVLTEGRLEETQRHEDVAVALLEPIFGPRTCRGLALATVVFEEDLHNPVTRRKVDGYSDAGAGEIHIGIPVYADIPTHEFIHVLDWRLNARSEKDHASWPERGLIDVLNRAHELIPAT